MHTLQPTTWNEIFEEWAGREEENPNWIRTATEVKGWPDWRSWRSFSAEQMKLPTRSWHLEVFDDPMIEIPALLVGPYSGWQSKMPTANQGSFADLVAIPKEYEFYRQNTNLIGMAENYPSHTRMIGLRRPDGKIICLEGHHRSVCVALEAHEGKTIHFSSPMQIAIADLAPEEGTFMDEVLARGTTKEPRQV